MKPEVKDLLRTLKVGGGLEEVKREALEEVKNQCADKIVVGEDEDLLNRAWELKYRVKTIMWLFDTFLENQLTEKVDKRVK